MKEWRPLFSERLAMTNMNPVHRWLHARFSPFHHRVTRLLWNGEHAPGLAARAWFWLWRQYRKTWVIR